MNILVKYFDKPDYKCKRLEKIHKGDWIDLYASEDTFVSTNTNKPTLVPLGVAMKLPPGYEAHVAPRSSTFKTWGIIQTNSFGIIDNSYSGDNDQWMLPVICINPKDIQGTLIKAGDKICQFRIIESMPEVNITEVEHLDDTDRGGFGSTGKN